MTPETTKTYVEVLYPGSLFPEEEVAIVDKREPQKIAKKYPYCFCFQFYDLTTARVTVDGVEQTACGKRKNLSPKYYPGGTVMTVGDVKKLPGDHSILISNMQCNGWKKVVKTRRGNFQPLENGDVIL